ncbi:MAG: hypothetical protein ABI772_13345 [Bacteroidota bacterium]
MPDSHEISLSLAAQMTKAYRDADLNNTISSAYSKEAFERLLSQEDCEGIRCYYAMTTSLSHPENPGRLTLVMVGTDKDGNDMYDRELMEMAIVCPEQCPQENPLNTMLT